MTDTGDPRIRLALEGQLALVTIARPDKLNALDANMVLALERAALLVDAESAVRVAIITGEGDRSFCAGGDIEAWSKLAPRDFGMSWVRHGHRAFDALARMRPPLIAVLNGHTLGGGLELAAAADFRIAERHVKLGSPETSIGVIPGWSGTQRAVRRFGTQATRRMVLAGEVFGAAEALALGLVDRVAAEGQGMVEARALAARIAMRAPAATELAKRMILAAEGEDAESAIEVLAGMAAAASPELAAGIAAFRNRKKPEF